MIRWLIILLLIVGCDIIEPEGICVLMYTNNDSYVWGDSPAYRCLPQTTKSQCISDSENNDAIIMSYWGDNYDCNEFCSEQISSPDTCIVN